LAGGVGGAKFADGLAQVINPRMNTNKHESIREDSWRFVDQSLSVVVNVGDDFDHLGLRICPDLDTVVYTLAGIANPETGWGLSGETWQAMDMLDRLGGATWFRLGDRDLGMHLFRTAALKQGKRLTEIIVEACVRLGVKARVLPATDSPVPTIVETDQGVLEFQEYFVHRHCEPSVRRLRFQEIELARPTDEVIAAIDAADLIVVCPSNPLVSIDPILAIGDLRERVKRKPVVGVSPIIGGQAVKGPAAKMLRELGYESSALSVAQHYADLLDMFVIDNVDSDQRAEIERLGVRVLVTDTLMKSVEDRARLAAEVVNDAARTFVNKDRVGRHVLFVSEDADMCKLVEAILTRERNDRVKCASYLQRAQLVTEQAPSDLVIIDFTSTLYTGIDGLQVYQQLRSIPVFKNVPALLWRIPNPQKVYPEAQRLGVAGCIEYVSTPQDLVKARDAALMGDTYYPPLNEPAR
jgi:LPPG:FO 2-phospho-L-lactate transferase